MTPRRNGSEPSETRSSTTRQNSQAASSSMSVRKNAMPRLRCSSIWTSRSRAGVVFDDVPTRWAKPAVISPNRAWAASKSANAEASMTSRVSRTPSISGSTPRCASVNASDSLAKALRSRANIRSKLGIFFSINVHSSIHWTPSRRRFSGLMRSSSPSHSGFTPASNVKPPWVQASNVYTECAILADRLVTRFRLADHLESRLTQDIGDHGSHKDRVIADQNSLRHRPLQRPESELTRAGRIPIRARMQCLPNRFRSFRYRDQALRPRQARSVPRRPPTP